MALEPNPKRFRGATAELLAMENDRVLSVLKPALHRLLDLAPASADEINPAACYPVRTTPALTLRLLTVDETKRAQALSAFSVLIEHSRRLREYPDAKRAFWLGVLQSRMSWGHMDQVPDASLREPAFPLFVVNFHDGTYDTFGKTLPPFMLLEDAVVEFFTTPPVMPTPTQTQFQPRSDVNGPDAVALELKFADCRLTSVDAVEAVERVLARVFTHPRRQFAVSALDLSENQMTPSELAVVARIARRCRYEYQVSELRLDGIMPGSRSTNYCPNTTPREFLDIMRAAYGVEASVLSAASTGGSTEIVKDAPIRASTLRSVSLKNNYVCLMYFEALFSALRYGGPIHEDFSKYVAKDRKGLAEKTLCRSWQAFGLFYPRPKRFRKLLGLRNVGCLECSRDVVEAFTKALHNPATQLAYGGVDPTGTNAAATELLVCTVKKGASVQFIKHEIPKPVSTRLRDVEDAVDPKSPSQPDTLEIEAECELEGLCERDSDGAVCVVVPGVGLGWVQRDGVECIEREPLESAWKHQDGRYAVQLARCPLDKKYAVMGMMSALLALVGRQISSLRFKEHDVKFSIVPQIIQHCPNLRHLSLQGVDVSKRDAGVLLDALRTGPLRTRLLTLNLNGSRLLYMYNDIFLQKLATILGAESSNSIGSEDRLALQELRVHHRQFGKKIVTVLTDALRTNRSLRLLQLTLADRVYSTDVYAKQNEMREVHDGQLLRRALPTEAKLAFLSVANLESPHALDTNLVAHIFQFASTRDVCRVIALSQRQRH